MKDVKGRLQCVVMGQKTFDKNSFQPNRILRLALIDTFDGSIIKIQEDGLVLSVENGGIPEVIELEGNVGYKIEYVNMEDMLKLPHKYEPTGNVIEDTKKMLSGEYV